jgi:hypothetical protein
MAGIGLAFSVVATGVFMYPLISNLVKPNSAKATVVAITVGSTGVQNDNQGMEGNVPNLAVYAENGEKIGYAHGTNKKVWAAGTTNFVSINPDKGMEGRQATYVSIANGGANAICISAVSVAWPDNSTPKGWLGDIAYNCSTADGPLWANSVTQTGSDPEFQAKCVWIDGDGTNGIPHQGFSLHIVDFGRTDGAVTKDGAPTTNAVAQQWNDNNDLLCKAPGRMNFYENFLPDDFPIVYQPPLVYNQNGTDKDPNAVMSDGCDDDPELIKSPCAARHSRKSKRGPRVSHYPRGLNSSTPLAKTIVHSNSSAHVAEELCNHPGSYSPSFVSYYEGKFCDMATRIVWPLCSDAVSSKCFDTEFNKLILDHDGLSNTTIDLLNPSSSGENVRVIHW